MGDVKLEKRYSVTIDGKNAAGGYVWNDAKECGDVVILEKDDRFAIFSKSKEKIVKKFSHKCYYKICNERIIIGKDDDQKDITVYAVYDFEGNMLTDFCYISIWNDEKLSHYYLCFLTEGRDFGIMDTSGNEKIIIKRGNYYKTFKSGVIFKDDGKYGVFFLTKGILVPAKYEEIKVKEGYGVIAKKGDNQYDLFTIFGEKINDFDVSEVIPYECKYTNYFLVKRFSNGQEFQGVYNTRGKVIVPCEYTRICIKEDGIIIAWAFEEVFSVFDNNGKELYRG